MERPSRPRELLEGQASFRRKNAIRGQLRSRPNGCRVETSRLKEAAAQDGRWPLASVRSMPQRPTRPLGH